LAASADGSHLVAITVGPTISLSTNAGVSWAATVLPPRSDWYYSAASADGVRLAVAGQKGVIYTTTNFGQNWVSNDVPQLLWTGLASSADGNFLVAVTVNQGIWIRRTAAIPNVNLTPNGGGDLKLSWTVPSTNVLVQQSADLLGWSNYTCSPALNGTNLQAEVILSNAPGSVFYRLKTP
jgi:hypothetical protein